MGKPRRSELRSRPGICSSQPWSSWSRPSSIALVMTSASVADDVASGEVLGGGERVETSRQPKLTHAADTGENDPRRRSIRADFGAKPRAAVESIFG